MSATDDLFKQAVKKLSNSKKKFSLILGTVKAIDDDTCTVDEHEDVRLNAVIDDLDSQFTIYPKVGSKVIIGRIEGEDDCFVVRVSKIEKVIIKIGDQVFEMKNGKFSIRKGNISLKSILNKGFNQLQNSVIATPSGPGSFSPADITAFTQINTEVNQLLQ